MSRTRLPGAESMAASTVIGYTEVGFGEPRQATASTVRGSTDDGPAGRGGIGR